MKRILIAANPHSAHGRGAKILRQAEAELARQGVQSDTLVSQYGGHLLHTLPARLHEQWDVIAVLGGDGTLFQVVNVCLRHPGFNTPLALVPAGTGNSFSQEFRVASLQPPWRRLIEGEPVAIDALHCKLERGVPGYGHDFHFINVLGVGFVSEVNITSQRYKKLGMLAYGLGVFLTLAKFKAARVRMILDDRIVERKCMFAMICNSRYTGGNMKVAPQALIDDGLMEVVLLNEVSRLTLVRAFPSVFSGNHVHHPKVEIFRCRKLRFESGPVQVLTPDGEVLGETPMNIEVLPQRLRFIL